MNTVSGFKTAEEAAIDLELPLLGTLPAPGELPGPIAPYFPDDERARREYGRAADRILLSPLSRQRCVGLLGDVTSARRARVAAALAAMLAAQKTVTLLDGDLRGAHLSFDDRGHAQEGIVDVLRYGVRSPRVVAPTQAPGLNLLPVGSDTVDYAGTYGSESTVSLFDELRRSGDLLVVNGPDCEDLAVAGPFVMQVDAWVLIHELGASDGRRTRDLRDALGRERCVGILVVESEGAALDVPLAGGGADLGAPEIVADPTAAPPLPAGIDPQPTVEESFEPAVEEPVRLTAEESFAPSAREDPFAPPVETRAFEPEPDVDATLPAPEVEESIAAGAEDSPVAKEAPVTRMTWTVPPPEQSEVEVASEEETEEWGGDQGESKRGGFAGIAMGVGIVVILAAAFLFFRSYDQENDAFHPVLDSPPRPGGEVSSAPASDAEAPGEPALEGPEETGSVIEADGDEAARIDDVSPGPEAGSELAEVAESPVGDAPETGEVVAGEVQPSADEGTSRAEEVELLVRDEPPPPPVTTGSFFGVHVSSLRGEDKARQDARRFEKAGYRTLTRSVEVPSKGTWVRVYVGPYETRENAQSVAGEIKSAGLASYTRVYELQGMGQGDR